jgi:hypothetical protein
MKMHERRGTEREYTCNICGEVFRNIFPFQAHQPKSIKLVVGNVNRVAQLGKLKDREMMNWYVY